MAKDLTEYNFKWVSSDPRKFFVFDNKAGNVPPSKIAARQVHLVIYEEDPSPSGVTLTTFSGVTRATFLQDVWRATSTPLWQELLYKVLEVDNIVFEHQPYFRNPDACPRYGASQNTVGDFQDPLSQSVPSGSQPVPSGSQPVPSGSQLQLSQTHDNSQEIQTQGLEAQLDELQAQFEQSHAELQQPELDLQDRLEEQPMDIDDEAAQPPQGQAQQHDPHAIHPLSASSAHHHVPEVPLPATTSSRSPSVAASAHDAPINPLQPLAADARDHSLPSSSTALIRSTVRRGKKLQVEVLIPHRTHGAAIRARRGDDDALAQTQVCGQGNILSI